MPTNPSIVFCHGIWADGSSFSKVIPPLQAEGYEVIAAQYGLDTPEGDVATVKRTLGRVGSPAILVGHSYGGSVITAAGTDDRVVGLVYIAALANDAGETSQSQQEKFPVTDVFKYVEVADGRIWDAAGRRRPLRRRSVGTRAEGRLGHPRCAGCRLVQPECAWDRVEVEAVLVHRGQQRPDGSARSATLSREAHGSHHPSCRQQPRGDAVSARRRGRRDSGCRERCSRCVRYGLRRVWDRLKGHNDADD